MRTIVLRKTGMGPESAPVQPVGTRGSPAVLPTGASGTITFEVRDTNPEAMRGEDDVLAAAPGEMPVRLIKPLTAGAEPAGQPPSISWGIEAVGAASDTLGVSGRGVAVAVLDTGIDRSHPAFSGVSFAPNDIKDFTGESPPDDPVQDTDGHGTHCAGTIFGRDVNGSRIGVARGVTRAIIGKVLGQNGGTTEKIVEAVMWAYHRGAQIISLSIGMDFPGYREWLVSQGLHPKRATAVALSGYVANVRLFDTLAQLLSQKNPLMRGAVLVAAAGNESERPAYTIGVAPPAAGDRFVSVAALGQDAAQPGRFTVASFSNEDARLAAPGVNIWSARAGGGLAAMSGTSMATPHVAGVTALWIEKLAQNGAAIDADIAISNMMRGTRDLSSYLSRGDVGMGLAHAPLP